MYERSQKFILAEQAGEAPLVILGLRTAGGRRIYSGHTPTLSQSGFKSSCQADGAWLAGGDVQAGAGSEAVLSRDRSVNRFGRVVESLSPGGGQLIGMLSGGRLSELAVWLDNDRTVGGGRGFSRLAAVEDLVGSQGQVTVNYPNLEGREAMLRFTGRIRRVELTRTRAVLRLRAA